MRRILLSIDRWGPALISVVTFLFLSAFGWTYSAKVAKVEGQVTALQNQINNQAKMEDAIRSERDAIRAEMAGVTKWMIAVHERGSALGWDLPELPKDIIVNKNPPEPKKEKKK